MPAIVERVFVDESGNSVTIAIDQPHPDPDPTGDWICTYRVGEAAGHAHGVDGLQALLLAVEGARLDAAKLSRPWTWLGVRRAAGDVGIPRTVPDYFGRAFARKIERFIDQEIEAFPATVRARRRRARRGRAQRRGRRCAAHWPVVCR
jgi:hypothetical protein